MIATTATTDLDTDFQEIVKTFRECFSGIVTRSPAWITLPASDSEILDLKFNAGETIQHENLSLEVIVGKEIHGLKLVTRTLLALSKKWGKKVEPTQVPNHVEFPCTIKQTAEKLVAIFPIKGGQLMLEAMLPKGERPDSRIRVLAEQAELHSNEEIRHLR